MKRDSIISKGARLLVAAGLLLAAAGQAQAQQGQSLEERLRAQLRTTTTQLQEAQNELAALKAGRPSGAAPAAAGKAPSGDADSLRKEVAELKAQLASERGAREHGAAAQQQAQAALGKAHEQVAQYRSSYDGLLKIARASEAERQRLAGDEKQRQQAMAMCAEKNAKLYSVGQEILSAYENMDVGTLMSVRQPFAAQSRVKYEQIAQEYGDKLYDGRFDARAASQPPAAGAPAAPQQ
jgi:DNA repair exonuclease SbcCD ATPase subunit